VTGDLFLLPVSGLGVSGIIALARRQAQVRRDTQRQVYRLYFPAELTVEAVVAFLRGLAALRSTPRPLDGLASLAFEVVATANEVAHYLLMPEPRADFVLGQLRVAIPDLGVVPATRSITITRAGSWRTTNERRPLRLDQPAAAAAALLASLRPLGPGEQVVWQWLVAPARPAQPPTSRSRSRGYRSAGLRQLVEGQPADVLPLYEERQKLAEPAFLAKLRIGARATFPGRAISLIRRSASVLRVVERPGVGFVRSLWPGRWVRRDLLAARTPLAEFGAHLTAAELAAVIAWPIGTPQVAGLNLGTRRRLAPGPQIPTDGLVLGTSDLPGSDRPVALAVEDAAYQAVVTGATGSGKTTLITQLILQDIAQGRGAVTIDPKGDLIADLVDRIPDQRIGDVILLDLAGDASHPTGMNLLAGADRNPELVTNEMVTIFRQRWGTYLGPRSSDLLTAGLLTLVKYPGATLCELPNLLVDSDFRRRLTAQIPDPFLSGMWAAFENLSEGERAATIGPLMNKIRPWILMPRLRNVIGQSQPTWSFDQALARNQIVLVNLAKGEIGTETAALLGSLVLAQLWAATRRRRQRHPFRVTIDEFQDLVGAGTDLADVLAQARSFGVGAVLCTQYLGRLDPALRQAVAVNARTKISFQAGGDDARLVAPLLGQPVTPTDLAGLEAYHAYAALCSGGRVQPPVSLRTHPLPPALGSAQRVRAASREQFGRARAEVEADILRRQGLAEASAPQPLGRRRRSA
jgi:hypothetical protein